jgi:hypothetical protein
VLDQERLSLRSQTKNREYHLVMAELVPGSVLEVPEASEAPEWV